MWIFFSAPIAAREARPHHVALPRGCLDEAVGLLRSNGVAAVFEDQREFGSRVDLRFLGTLHAQQQEAFDAVIEHDFGVLPAPTAFGKTVIAAAGREYATKWTGSTSRSTGSRIKTNRTCTPTRAAPSIESASLRDA